MMPTSVSSERALSLAGLTIPNTKTNSNLLPLMKSYIYLLG